MQRLRTIRKRGGTAAVIGAAVAALLFAAAAKAETPAEFYKKSGLRLVVASGAGGGYDTYSRVFARSYTKHIPGKPRIVVQNMDGASGLIATNWTYNSAPRDGSRILATYNTLLSATLLGNTKAKFDVRKFGWLGSIAKSQLLCVTWKGRSPYTKIQELVGKPITVSATGRTGNSATLPLILNQLMGTRFKVIMGYSTTGSRLALERGEVDGICGLGLSTLRASNPEWFVNNKINIVAQIGLTDLDELKGVPNPVKLVSADKRQMFEFIAIQQEMGRPYVAPPAIPADRLAALRTAFDDTMKDPGLIADMKKLHLEVSPLTGQDMDGLIAKLYGFSPQVVQQVAHIFGVAKTAKVDNCAKVSKDKTQCRKKKKKKKKKKSS